MENGLSIALLGTKNSIDKKKVPVSLRLTNTNGTPEVFHELFMPEFLL